MDLKAKNVEHLYIRGLLAPRAIDKLAESLGAIKRITGKRILALIRIGRDDAFITLGQLS